MVSSSLSGPWVARSCKARGLPRTWTTLRQLARATSQQLQLGALPHPVAERLAETSLSLPIYPGITESQIAYVVEQVRAFFDG